MTARRVLNVLVPLLAVGIGCLGVPARAAAQTAGVKAGVNLFRFEASETPTSETQRMSGLAAGVYGTFTNTRLTAQVEALYSVWRTRFNTASVQTLRLTWLEVPVLARVNVVRSGRYADFHVLVGPSFAFKLDAQVEENTSANISDQLERYDVGLLVGAGFDVGHLVVEGRYTTGLRNLDKSLGSGSIKNRTITLLAGVRFH